MLWRASKPTYYSTCKPLFLREECFDDGGSVAMVTFFDTLLGEKLGESIETKISPASPTPDALFSLEMI